MKAKKQIKKLENRIEKIEKELERNSSFTLSKDVLRGITEPKLEDVLVKGNTYVEEEKPFVLPEKWCITTTPENNDAVKTYLINEHLYDSDNDWSVGNHYCFDYLGAHGWMHHAPERKEGYTEITFEQFKQHVLKEDYLTTVERMLEEPKPVESDTFKNLKLEDVQVNVEDCSEEEIKQLIDVVRCNGVKVTEDETELSTTNIFHFFRMGVIKDYFLVAESQDKTTLTPSQFCEMFGNKEIDWSKAGQLVENKFGVKLLTNGNHHRNHFSATLIFNEDNGVNVGKKFDNNEKEHFTLCIEPITLNN